MSSAPFSRSPFAFGGATVHDHALTSVVFAILSLLLFGALSTGTGLGGPPRGTVLATVPLLGAWVVLDWGLLAGVTRSWSIYSTGSSEPLSILSGVAARLGG